MTNKLDAVNLGPPELITIAKDDYHAKHVGLTHSDEQFFVTELFVPAIGGRTGNEFEAVFLFNAIGDLLESRVDELGPRGSFNHEYALALRAQRLEELDIMMFQDIRVKPFAVEHYGLMMGLIPSKYQERWTVELIPGNFMAFNEPWDSGKYDT